jgi:hypothetical protein
MDYEEEDKEEFTADTPETDDLEPAEDILARQVELVTPAIAKEAADKIIRAKKQVTFLEKTAITKEQTAIVEEEPAQVPTETPPPPQEKGKEIWKPVKPRSQTKPAAKATEQDRSCWLYLYNYVSRDTQTRRYKGEKEDWKLAVSKQLGRDFALVTGCIRVAAPPGEQRLVLECPTKSSRRQLYAGIRRSKGDIRCNISLTKLEYENK